MKSNILANPFRLKQEGIFTDKMIASLLIPILIEEIMIAVITIADTAMVASVGETAVAGISLVATVNNLIKQMLVALATGCGVVIAQYIGKKDLTEAGNAMKTGLYSILFLSFSVSLVSFIFKRSFLSAMFGHVEEDVFKNALLYFSLSLVSYPFLAIYHVGAASFRAMGNSRIPMFCSFMMMGMDLLIKAILIYGFKIGVAGAGISTITATAFVSGIMLLFMTSYKNTVRIKDIIKINVDFPMIKRILGIGIPNSIEKGFFQFGLLILQRLTASFGTAALAANAIAKSLTPISYTLGATFSLGIINIVGQCMGAKKTEQAVMYTKHMLKINYILGFIVNACCIIFAPAILKGYNLSEEAYKLSYIVFSMYCTGSMIIYPLSTVLPFALRGAGDTKFTMMVSTISMFGARIGLAYVFARGMGMGLIGVWLSMVTEWIAKGIVFLLRFNGGKWKEIKVV